MDPDKALADLKEISTQIRQAVILDASASMFASTVEDETGAQAFADAASRFVKAVDEVAAPRGKPVAQVEAVLEDGSVAIAREDERTIVATTGPQRTIGLVFYDLRTCLRSLAAAKPRRKRAPRKKKDDDAA